MQDDKKQRLEFLLRFLMEKYSDIFSYHQWLSEHDRWVELLYCVLAEALGKDEYFVRDIVDRLDLIGALEVEEIAEGFGKSGTDAPVMENITIFLKDNVFSADEIAIFETTLGETATAVMQSYGGKVQKFLRAHGEKILAEAKKEFSFTHLDSSGTDRAFRYWLQNVLNMPISIEDASIEQFCKMFDVEAGDVFATADEMNVNLALLDDMIKLHTVQQA